MVIGANWWSYFVKQVQNEGEFDREYYFQLNGEKEYFKGGNGVGLSLDALAEFLEFLASFKKVYLILNSPVSPTLSPKNFMMAQDLVSSDINQKQICLRVNSIKIMNL